MVKVGRRIKVPWIPVQAGKPQWKKVEERVTINHEYPPGSAIETKKSPSIFHKLATGVAVKCAYSIQQAAETPAGDCWQIRKKRK